MRIADIRTPAMLVDIERVERNCHWMSERAHALKVKLRPHMKTHKIVEMGRIQTAGHFGGITVSTIAEARHFRAAGVGDITLGVPIAPAKAREAVGMGLNLLVDSMAAIDAIESACDSGATADVWLKVDCGYGRAGVNPGDASAIAIAERLSRHDRIRFAGLLTHGGHSYDCVGREAILAVAQQERDAVVAFAGQLRALGVDVAGVSVGSTPTMMHVDHLKGVTEIRPGNYAMFDGFQASIGSCEPDQVAGSVLATVLSVHADRAIVDAGALAMSKDPGNGSQGFGLVLNVDGVPFEGLQVVGLSQEHGKIKGPELSRLSVGDRVRIPPNHSCLAMACFDEVHAVRGGVVESLWRPCRGW